MLTGRRKRRPLQPLIESPLEHKKTTLAGGFLLYYSSITINVFFIFSLCFFEGSQ